MEGEIIDRIVTSKGVTGDQARLASIISEGHAERVIDVAQKMTDERKGRTHEADLDSVMSFLGDLPMIPGLENDNFSVEDTVFFINQGLKMAYKESSYGEVVEGEINGRTLSIIESMDAVLKIQPPAQDGQEFHKDMIAYSEELAVENEVSFEHVMKAVAKIGDKLVTDPLAADQELKANIRESKANALEQPRKIEKVASSRRSGGQPSTSPNPSISIAGRGSDSNQTEI